MVINTVSNTAPRIIYDKLSEDYSSNKHNTVKFMVAVENLKIAQAVAIFSAYQLKKSINDINLLNIGVGNGLHRYMVTDYLNGPLGQSMNDDNFFDFDISKKMLNAADSNYRRVSYNKDNSNLPKIQGDAVLLPFKDGSFDVVLAGLCDHVSPQTSMYNESFRVLKDNGIFIVTYPSKKLMETIRDKIYHIDKKTTRFKIDGKYHMISSTPMTPQQIRSLFRYSGFDSSLEFELDDSDSIYIENDGPSKTVVQASKLLKTNPSDLTIVPLGIGFKGDYPVKEFNLLNQNQLATLEDMIYYYNPKPEKVHKYGL